MDGGRMDEIEAMVLSDGCCDDVGVGDVLDLIAEVKRLKDERDAYLGLLIKEQQQATGRPTFAVRTRLTEFFGTYEAALAFVRKAAGLT